MNLSLAEKLRQRFRPIVFCWFMAFANFGLNLSPAAAQNSSDVEVYWVAENSGLYNGESSSRINPIPVNLAGAFIVYSSPEEACNYAVTHNLSPLNRLVAIKVNDVEEIYHSYTDRDYSGESFNQTVVGKKCLFTYKFFAGIAPDQEERTITDSWYGNPIARPVCARAGGSALANYEVEFGDEGAGCVNSADKSDNEDPNSGETVSSSPRVTVGDPIEVDTGAAISTVVDYSTADAMLSINRNYRSAGSMRGGMIAKNIEPGFGLKWRGLLPGHMLFCNTGTNVTLRFTDERGSQTSFNVSAGAAWSFVSREETRLAVNMLAPVMESPMEFILASAALGTGAPETAEFRVATATGDAIYFRRAGEYNPLDQCRRAVPVRKVLANGYVQNYAYGSIADVYPSSISDNLGRQIGISWRDAGKIGATISGVFGGPDATGPEVAALQPLKVISRLELPDGTSMQYDYSAVGTSEFLGNLSQAKRVAADGISILWAQGYSYEDARDKSALTGISDLSGNRISTFAYGADGRAIKTEGNGGFGTYSISYDEENDVRVVTNPLGLKTTYQYTSQEGTFNVSIINPGPTDPNSPPPPPPPPGDCGGDCFSETAVSLSRLPRLLYSKSTEATANVESEEFRFGYDFKGQVSNRTDANGRVSVISNISGEGRPSMFTDARGVKTSIAWHPTLDLPARTVRKRLQTDFGYDAAGQLTSSSVTDLDSGEVRTTQYEMGVAGRVLSVNGPRAPDAEGRDDITNMTYDAQGNMLTMTNPFGHVTRFEGYDANGRAARMIDANGAVTEFTYDTLGRVKSSIAKHPTDATKDAGTGMEYDVEGRVVSVTRPDTAKLNFDYNLAGLMTAIRSDDGERIDYSYDPMGNRLSETVQRADGSQVSNIQRTFDEIGRMLSVTLGPGRTHRYAYDKVGNVVRQTTARGGVQLNSYDALNRLVQTVTPDGASFSNRYDGDSERVSILDTDSNDSLVVSPGSGAQNELGLFKDGVGGKTRFTRNAFGQVIQEISPARGTTLYEYDAAGDLRAMVDGRGQRIEYTRDILGRVLTKTPVGRPASERVTYTYDTATVNGSFAIGRLSRVDDGSGATRFSYDHRGNMILRYQRLVGSSDWVALRYRYDLADRIDLITYPSGRQVLYVRDAKGRVSAVRSRGSNTAGAWTTVSSAMTYEAFGPLRTIAYGNGERMIISYGDDGRMDGRRLFRTADGTNISHLAYGYDADDNITRITDRLDATKTMRFTYDAVNRLTRVTAATGSAQRTDYTFDKNGNRTEVLTRPLATDPASAATAEIYQNNLATLNSQLEAIIGPNGTRSFVYDARGNLVSETRPGGITINTAYDGYGRLTGYARSGEASLAHVYNGLDDRVATTTTLAGGGSDTRRFIYAPDGRVLGEYGASAADIRAEFIWMSPEVGDAGQFGGDDGLGGYMPLAVSTPDPIAGAGATQLSWVHASHMGVPLRYSDASGNTLSAPGSYSVPGFPGQSQTFSDLYYNRYRDYDSSTGRYIQADPIGLAGGPSPYSYAMNNPLRYTDPTGEFVPAVIAFCLTPAGAVACGAVTGAVTDLAIQAGSNWWNGRDVFNEDCYDWSQVAMSGGIGGLTGGAGAWLMRGGRAAGAGFGDLTVREARQIQKVVDQAGRPLSVVGSAAKGARRAGSDIDYVVSPSSIPYYRGLETRLPRIDPRHGIIPGYGNPHIGPVIPFTPR